MKSLVTVYYKFSPNSYSEIKRENQLIFGKVKMYKNGANLGATLFNCNFFAKCTADLSNSQWICEDISFQSHVAN